MLKAIIVDDEPYCCEALATLMEDFSDVEIAAVCHNAADALVAIQKHSPDLVFLDVEMPKMNGFDVLAWLKGRPDMGSLPVVVLSSSSVEEDEAMALRMGAREFRTKPADIDNLVPLLKGLHKRWLEQTPFSPEIWRTAPHEPHRLPHPG